MIRNDDSHEGQLTEDKLKSGATKSGDKVSLDRTSALGRDWSLCPHVRRQGGVIRYIVSYLIDLYNLDSCFARSHPS